MFVSTAFAQTSGGSAGGMDIMGMLPLVLLFVLLYFLMIRPQAKKQKEHKRMLDALAEGDEVVAGGGVLGKVTYVGDQFVKLEITSGTEIVIQKPAVQTVLPKGTLKSATN
ncbi:MAG: preprotein translocase subunit YajC [Proteobacteria bacterium]|nr:preprotein translocase subunit YajC [Pseudomonadota bacterium]MDA1330921.1 preprotein translocase subunit YajC [Pseudomonadota bacterium]